MTLTPDKAKEVSEPRTDIWGAFAIWLWGKKVPMEIYKCQRFVRNSPLGEYVKEIEAENARLREGLRDIIKMEHGVLNASSKMVAIAKQALGGKE